MTSLFRRRVLQGLGISFWGSLITLPSVFASDVKSANTRIALIIGNSAYPKNPLINPINDAKAMSTELSLMGFEVNRLLDANLSQLENEILKFTTRLNKERCIGLFYYAGHGVQLNWRNYLIPVDADIRKPEDIPSKTFELNVLFGQLIKASNSMNIIILDACRDNPFGKTVVVDQKGLGQFDAPPGSILSYATGPGNVANDGVGKNGLFTENLLKEMINPTAKIEDVFKRVRLNVRLASKGSQIPWESTSLEQDFYFNAAGVDPAIINERVTQALKPMMVEVNQLMAIPIQVNAVVLPPAVNHPISSNDKKINEEDRNQQFNDELQLWEKAKVSSSKDLTIQYIKYYPNGSFSELAQTRLDLLLRKEGEKKIQVVSPNSNPFSKGTSSGILKYNLRDKFVFEVNDILTGVLLSTSSELVTSLSDENIIFNDGIKVIDRMGNELVSQNPKFITPAQFFPNEYSVGNKWRTEFTRMRTPVSLGPAAYYIDFVIEKREMMKTSLGNFNAFKIVGEGRNSYGGKLLISYWIDPDNCPAPLVFELWGRGNNGRLDTSERTVLSEYIKGRQSTGTS